MKPISFQNQKYINELQKKTWNQIISHNNKKNEKVLWYPDKWNGNNVQNVFLPTNKKIT